jgi:hypothetical protein
LNIPFLLSHLPALAALAAGVLILARPRFLTHAVTGYLLTIGAIGLVDAGGHNIALHPALAIAAGITLLVRPTLLNPLLAAYLILTGLLELGLLH